MPIPCHLIAGPLGVGKTTSILDYVQRNAGWEKVAVLVNDFGPVGLDGPILESGGVSDIVNIPGGCICCSASEGLLSGFRKIAKIPGIRRIIVEPSGIAAPSEIIDHLRSLAPEYGLELGPVIGLLDLRDIDEAIDGRMPFYQRLVDASDILVANRSDLASGEKATRFLEWARGLYPPKVDALVTHHGQLPDRLFNPGSMKSPPRVGLRILKEEVPLALGRGTQSQHRHHDHGIAQKAGGLILDSQIEFEMESVHERLSSLVAQGFQGVRPVRLKAVVNTDSGWKLVEIARGDVFVRATDYRRDNRIDWIVEGDGWDDEAFGKWWRGVP